MSDKPAEPAASGYTAPENSTVLTYTAPHATNSLSWSRKAPYRLGVGSFINAYSNSIHVISRDGTNLVRLGVVNHYYPPTKLMFSPEPATAGVDDGRQTDNLITSGDYLRLWSLTDGAPPTATSNTVGAHPDQAADRAEAEGKEPHDPTQSQTTKVSSALSFTFKHSTKPGVSEDFCAPLTSFDWCTEDTHLVAACSIDTTVSIWDIEKTAVTVHLIAHDKEVFDVAFRSKSSHVFATAGADGSIRIFDTRRMDHCTVVYETVDASVPMMRVEWNKQDTNYIAALSAECNDVVVFDVRYPSASEAHLRNGHTGPLNSIAWAPHAQANLCTAGEDGRAIIWDTTAEASTAEGVLTYAADGPLNCVSWSVLQTDWIAVSFEQSVQMLHV